jgi:hypothetical protein
MALSGGERRSAPRLRIWVIAAFTVALVVLGGLRFARADLAGTSFFATDEYYTWTTDEGRFIDHLNIDISQYLAMVEDYRGVDGAFEKQEPYEAFEDTGEAVKGPVDPFTSRVALPWLASLIPLDASYAWALVNLALLTVGLWFLVDALAVSGRSPAAQAVGAALYTFALPVVVFASSLFIDGGVVGVLAIGYWLLARRAWWALVVFFPVSYLVKESLLVLAPSAVWAWRTSGHRFGDARFVLGAGASALGVLGAAAWVTATAPEAVYSFTVLPTWQYIRWNFTNPTSAVFFVVGLSTVVVPALLGARDLLAGSSWSRALRGPSGPDLVGFGAVALMNAYSLFSTDLTLRTGWLLWPFAIGLAAVWVDGNARLRSRLEPVVGRGTAQPVAA